MTENNSSMYCISKKKLCKSCSTHFFFTNVECEELCVICIDNKTKTENSIRRKRAASFSENKLTKKSRSTHSIFNTELPSDDPLQIKSSGGKIFDAQESNTSSSYENFKSMCKLVKSKSVEEEHDVESEMQTDQQEDSTLSHTGSESQKMNENHANKRKLHNVDSTDRNVSTHLETNASSSKEQEDGTSEMKAVEITEVCSTSEQTKNSRLRFDTKENLVLPSDIPAATAMLDAFATLAVADLAKNPELDIRRGIHEIFKLNAEKSGSSEKDDQILEQEYHLTIFRDTERCLEQFGSFENAVEHFLKNGRMHEVKKIPVDHKDVSSKIPESSSFINSLLADKEVRVSETAEIQEPIVTCSLDEQTSAEKHVHEFRLVKPSLSSKVLQPQQGISEDGNDTLMDFLNLP